MNGEIPISRSVLDGGLGFFYFRWLVLFYPPGGEEVLGPVVFAEAADDDAFGGAGVGEAVVFEVDADMGDGAFGGLAGEEDKVAFAEGVLFDAGDVFLELVAGVAGDLFAVGVADDGVDEAGAVGAAFGTSSGAVGGAEPSGGFEVEGEVVVAGDAHAELIAGVGEGLADDTIPCGAAS